MRMWNVKPKLMCRKHLLGEHLEMHMFLGTLRKGRSIDGYVKKGLVEIHNIANRHEELARQMRIRNYKHNSSFRVGDAVFLEQHKIGEVDKKANLKELAKRCKECRKRMEELK